MCTFTFFAPFEYKRHLKFAHGLKHNNFKCVHCGHKMQSLSSLELHILKYHKGALKLAFDESKQTDGKSKQKGKRCLHDEEKIIYTLYFNIIYNSKNSYFSVQKI